MSRFDWPALMRLGCRAPALGGLGLSPEGFWALTPAELKLMLGEAGNPLRRAGLDALMAAYPDEHGKTGDTGEG
ncbi:phage tail assembly chaperone [Aquicoccus sp. SCR17]|nr:phage tail assembly chaperone [Carideicomes alvinocaridis]